MHNAKFSDYWWIDLPCFMGFFLILMSSLMFSLIGVELSLDRVFSPSLRPLVAPIVEEGFKFLTALLSIPFAIIFTALFALGEANNYINYAANHGFNEPTFYIMRGICVVFHFVTLFCQIFCLRIYYKYKYKIYLLAGYAVAVVLHLEWNQHFGRFVYINVLDWYSDFSTYLGL